MLLLSLMLRQYRREAEQIGRNIIKYKLYILVIFALVFDMSVPRIMAVEAAPPQEEISAQNTSTVVEYPLINEESVDIIEKSSEEAKEALEPKEPEPVIKYSAYVPCTAYNSDPRQTDSTPCITADGYDLCETNEENVIAANFLRFGTKVRFPDYFGDRIFIVHDRMNARYTYKVDFWMTGDTLAEAKQKARDFGYRRLKMEVLE